MKKGFLFFNQRCDNLSRTIYILFINTNCSLPAQKKATRTYVQEKTNYVCLHVHSCRKLLILHLRIPLFEIYSFIKNGCWIIHNKVTEITIKLFHYVYLHHIFFLQLFSRKAYIYTKLRYMTTQWKFLCGTIFLIKKNRFPWISYIKAFYLDMFNLRYQIKNSLSLYSV